MSVINLQPCFVVIVTNTSGHIVYIVLNFCIMAMMVTIDQLMDQLITSF